jgi:hypothetical protein
MRIELLCDHKWRDLPNLAALKIYLSNLGHTVLVTTTKDAQALAKIFHPDIVVLNHLFSEANRRLANVLKQSGIGVIVLPTEGVSHPEFSSIVHGAFSDYRDADLILAWGEPVAKGIRERWGFSDKRVPVLGCNRTDFYHTNYSAIIESRSKFCSAYNLDPAKPIVTWATQYGCAHLTEGSQSENLRQWLREIAEVGVKEVYERLGIPAVEVPKLNSLARDAAAKAFFKLAKAFPEVQFLIKPHPIEEQSYYRRWIEQSDSKNITFCPRTYIWNVLNASDIELHHHCTTAVEAWLWKKPTIEMNLREQPELAWPDREAGSDSVRDGDQLIAVVSDYLMNPTVSQILQTHRTSYVERWFGAVDGKRCVSTGAAIHEFALSLPPRRKLFQSIRGIEINKRDVVSAGLRYFLNKTPSQRLLLLKKSVPNQNDQDKLVVRKDVIEYCRQIRPSVMKSI